MIKSKTRNIRANASTLIMTSQVQINDNESEVCSQKLKKNGVQQAVGDCHSSLFSGDCGASTFCEDRQNECNDRKKNDNNNHHQADDSDYLVMVEDDLTQLRMGGNNQVGQIIYDISENNSDYLQMVKDDYNNLQVDKISAGQRYSDILISNI